MFLFSYKLRRVLRKCFNISERDFNNENLFLTTIPVVAEILGETFNELNTKLTQVLDIVKYEQELYKSLRHAMSKDVQQIIKGNPKLEELDMYDYPGFVKGYQDFCGFKKSSLNLKRDEIYYLHSSFGFDIDFIEQLAECEGKFHPVTHCHI